MKELKLDVSYFNLKYTLECGQCFRWKEIEPNTYIGVIKDRVLKVRQDNDTLYIISNKEENLEEVVRKYFGLDKDYEAIEKRIILSDEKVKEALTHTSGLRHLNQDFFETLISYIISANNNIPRISKSVNEISKRYGTKVSLDNDEYYLFPTAKQLKNVTVDEYRDCGVGFRDKYIYDTVKRINDGTLNLEELNKLETPILRKELLNIMGVGPKVADCIMLFSCGRQEIFPIDVWVERIMKRLYFNNDDKTTKKQIAEYADKHFGTDGGIIQQHLFYNVREGTI